MKNNLLIAITGPTGSGKSTVSKMLSDKLTQPTNIEIDHLKHFIVSGFERLPSGENHFNEWILVGQCVGLVAKRLSETGHTVIINGYMTQKGWLETQKHINLTHKFLLLPDLGVVEQRDAGRPVGSKNGRKTVKRHHLEFSTNPFYQDFVQIDSSSHSIEVTVDEIYKLVK